MSPQHHGRIHYVEAKHRLDDEKRSTNAICSLGLNGGTFVPPTIKMIGIISYELKNLTPAFNQPLIIFPADISTCHDDGKSTAVNNCINDDN